MQYPANKQLNPQTSANIYQNKSESTKIYNKYPQKKYQVSNHQILFQKLFAQFYLNIKNKSKQSLNILKQNLTIQSNKNINSSQLNNLNYNYSSPSNKNSTQQTTNQMQKQQIPKLGLHQNQHNITQKLAIHDKPTPSKIIATFVQSIPIEIALRNKNINQKFINSIAILQVQQNQSSKLMNTQTASKNKENKNQNDQTTGLIYSNQFLSPANKQIKIRRFIGNKKYYNHRDMDQDEFNIQEFQINNEQDPEFQTYVEKSRNLEGKLKTYVYRDQQYQHDRKLKTQPRKPRKIYQPKILIQGPEAHILRSNLITSQIKKQKDLSKKNIHREKIASYDNRKNLDIDLQNSRLNQLLIAEQKKEILQKKLQNLNEQIKNIKKEKIDLRNIKQQKNIFKRYQKISDSIQAKVNAVRFVRKLKNQRQIREKQISKVFHRIDYNILGMMSELQKIRNQRDEKSKEKKKIQILQRMRQHERKKEEDSKLKSQNVRFLNALKACESKKGIKLMTQSNTNDDDIYSRQHRYLNRKQISAKIQKVRNLTKMEKGSILEAYNRQLFIKKS